MIYRPHKELSIIEGHVGSSRLVPPRKSWHGYPANQMRRLYYGGNLLQHTTRLL